MKDQKSILFFLLKFIGLYIVLNTVYALWISSYNPAPDPMTKIVTFQVVSIISLMEDGVEEEEALNSPNVSMRRNGKTIVSVYEGCNGLNVMFVFLSFIVAYTGTLRKTILFCGAGLVLIYLSNLLRVGLLYFIAEYYPNNLYFFHKYLFTGLLYALIFLLWYFWVRKIWPEKT